MSCPSWQWHITGSSWSPVRTLQVAPLWCDLGFFPNSRGNKAAVNLFPTCQYSTSLMCLSSGHQSQKLLKAIKGFECKINDQVLGAVLLDSNCRSDGQVQTPGISKSVAVIAGHDWLNLQKVLPLLQ